MLAVSSSGANINRKMGRALEKEKLVPFRLERRADVNISAVSAPTVLSSWLFQSTVVCGEKAVFEDGYLDGFYSVAVGVLPCRLVCNVHCPEVFWPYLSFVFSDVR